MTDELKKATQLFLHRMAFDNVIYYNTDSWHSHGNTARSGHYGYK